MWQRIMHAVARLRGGPHPRLARFSDSAKTAASAAGRAIARLFAIVFRATWLIATVLVCFELWQRSVPALEVAKLSLWWAALGVAVTASAMTLVHPPKRLSTFVDRWTPTGRALKALEVVRWPLYLIFVVCSTAWVWSVWHGALAENWVALTPEALDQRFPLPFTDGTMAFRTALYALVALLFVSSFLCLPWSAPLLLASAVAFACVAFEFEMRLAFLPAVICAASALMAGRPYLWKAGERWLVTARWVPKRERTVPVARRLLWGTRSWLPKRDFVSFGTYKKPGARFSLFRMLNALALATVLWGTYAFDRIVAAYRQDLPKDLSAVTAYRPIVTTEVLWDDGTTMCTLSSMNRSLVSLDRAPKHLRQAIRSAEDKLFDRHHGFDTVGIMRAVKSNQDGGKRKQGASTLTQQVAKMILLSPEQTLERKIKELLLAVEIERTMTKDQIEEIYFNQSYFGRGAYGIQAAAQTYFGKDVQELTLAESIFLVSLLKAPSDYWPNPTDDEAKRAVKIGRLRDRMRYVAGRMVEDGHITPAQMEEALSIGQLAVFTRTQPRNRTAAATPCEYVRREAEQIYGTKRVFGQGLVITTTFSRHMQEKADGAVQNGLIDLERRLGFAGPEGHDPANDLTCEAPETVADYAIEPDARVIAIAPKIELCVRGNRFEMEQDDAGRVRRWEARTKLRLAVGDLLTVRVETRTEGKGDAAKKVRYATTARRTPGPYSLQAALVAVDPKTGGLKALVGGYDFGELQFSTATQGKRQCGSSCKMYVYLADLIDGGTVDEIVVDRPVCYASASGPYCPQNYRGPRTRQQYRGAVRKDFAMAQSLNSVSVQLAARVGVSKVIRTMRALGIRSDIVPVLPIAVGAVDLDVLEHTYAYATIAANGRKMPSQPGSKRPGLFITKVEAKGEAAPIYEYVPEPPTQAVPAAAAYSVTFLMRKVVEFGTGKRVRELGRPAAGKTGTTDDFKDAWFMGFTPDLAVGVWVGRQKPMTIASEATGGVVALPIWLGFMKAAHPDTPPREFPVPDDVVLIPDGGDLLPFASGHVPAKYVNGRAEDPSP